jgi:hypothetical protein
LLLLLLHSLCNTRGVALCSLLGYPVATLFVFEFGPAAFDTAGFLIVLRGLLRCVIRNDLGGDILGSGNSLRRFHRLRVNFGRFSRLGNVSG